MIEWKDGMPERWELPLYVLFVVLFFFLILVELVVILGFFVLLFLIFIVRDGIHLDRVDLHDLHLGFALGTGEDFAFLHLIFVDVNFSCAFGTANHGENLLRTDRQPCWRII